MTRFVLRRLAVIPVALLLIHFLGFAYAHLARPLRAARNPMYASQAETEPLWPAYRDYMQGAMRLDSGAMPGARRDDLPSGHISDTPQTVAAAVRKASVASLGLLTIALVLSTLLGLLLGLLAARPEPPRVSRWLTALSTLGLAMPSFFIGSLFILAVFRYQIWHGYGTKLLLPMGGFGWDKHLVLPTLALMARPAVQIAQIVAGLLVDELGKQYVVAARSVGNSWPRILRRNALRNILAAVVLSVAGSVRLLVGELVVVEWLFEWPGLGRLLAWTLIPPAGTTLVEGVPLFLSPPVVAAVLMALGGAFLLTDLIAAILVRFFDPRLRTPAEEGLSHA